MQIDWQGNVLMPPFKVEGIGARKNGMPALSLNGSNALNLWFLSSANGRVYRAVVHKKTLKTIKVIETPLKGFPVSDSILNVTKRAENNFVSLPVQTSEGIRVAAYPINQFGQVSGKRWFLSTPLSSVCDTGRLNCKGGFGSNGRLGYWIDLNGTKTTELDLFVRPLGAMGIPVQEPVFIDSITSRFRIQSAFHGADATATLPGNKRFFVYVKAHPPGVAFEKPQKLMLQQLDAVTGEKIGVAIELYRDELLYPNVKIDPAGRFVLFSANFTEFGSGLDGLLYLSLDIEGRPSGRPKLLTTRSGGIDLL